MDNRIGALDPNKGLKGVEHTRDVIYIHLVVQVRFSGCTHLLETVAQSPALKVPVAIIMLALNIIMIKLYKAHTNAYFNSKHILQQYISLAVYITNCCPLQCSIVVHYKFLKRFKLQVHVVCTLHTCHDNVIW